MQEEKKEENNENELDISVQASVTITKTYKLPLAKLSVCGVINNESIDTLDNKITQRAIIFVIDRSGSMGGSRMNMVKDTLKPFLEQICDDPNTIIRLVLFNREVEIVNIPKDRTKVGAVIDSKVYASGGTDFHSASKGLVQEANSILTQYPTHQLTIIMCSDGEVDLQNAKQGHSHWKKFVNSDYLKCHDIVPFVETIGISSDHEADILAGFIIDDVSGNYSKCSSSETIQSAFEKAQNETMGRSAVKLRIEFPLNVQRGVYGAESANRFTLHDLIVNGDNFDQSFWISLKDFDQTTCGNDGLYLIVNEQKVRIEINEVIDDNLCQHEALVFYHQVLKDMLFALRSIKNSVELKKKATEIENELNGEYRDIFKCITEPPEKRKLQNELKKLLAVNNGDDDEKTDLKQINMHRAELMKEYKTMSRVWKKHRSVVHSFQCTLSSLKKLVREINLGNARLQELRQHILDLHFNKNHAKRIERLVMTDNQLAQRQKKYEQIKAPTIEECKNISNGYGSGCYLSTLTKRECVMDAEPLWVCGRVDRCGGAAVSNPEFIRIEYISPDLVSDSYFKLALEATENNKGFADSCRELINCRLFPIYANRKHFECSKPYLSEAIGHTLSGRTDIRVVDYNCLGTVIGSMIGCNPLSYHNVKRLFTEIMPSYEFETEYPNARPFKLYSRDRDYQAPKCKLSDKNRQRLIWYTESFKARTSALVCTSHVLFADRLMNLDVKFADELYLSIIMQRMRGVFSGQISNGMDSNNERKKVEADHKEILKILICGVNDEQDDNDTKEIEFDLSIDRQMRFNVYQSSEMFNIPQIVSNKLNKSNDIVLAKWNVKKLKASSKKMMINILSHIEVRDLIQSKMFFDTLAKMKMSDIDYSAFGKNEFSDFNKIPNNLNILLKQIGFEQNLNVLRAICCVSIICHSNKLWKDNLHWFGDDEKKQIFKDPESVLLHIYRHFVIGY